MNEKDILDIIFYLASFCPNCNEQAKHIGQCIICAEYFCEHCIDEHFKTTICGCERLN